MQLFLLFIIFLIKTACFANAKPFNFDSEDCMVNEIASWELKPCESVFIYGGITYNGCTTEGSKGGLISKRIIQICTSNFLSIFPLNFLQSIKAQDLYSNFLPQPITSQNKKHESPHSCP